MAMLCPYEGMLSIRAFADNNINNFSFIIYPIFVQGYSINHKFCNYLL